jgi:hypothetical protein
VSKPLAKILCKKYERHVDVIYNGFDSADYETLPDKPFFPDDATTRIVYTGTIYPKFQDPTPLFRALNSLHESSSIHPDEIQVIFCGNHANIEEISRREGVTKFVQLKGIVPRKEALHMQRDADTLLFLEFDSPQLKGILSGKLFEYLYAGPPIMAVGIGNDSGVGRLLARTGTGICYGENIERIKGALLSLIRTGLPFPEGQIKRNKNEIGIFSRQKQANKLLQLVQTKDGICDEV